MPSLLHGWQARGVVRDDVIGSLQCRAGWRHTVHRQQGLGPVLGLLAACGDSHSHLRPRCGWLLAQLRLQLLYNWGRGQSGAVCICSREGELEGDCVKCSRALQGVL